MSMRWRQRSKTLVAGLLLATACDSDTEFTDEMPDDLPAGQCDDTSTGEDCETGGQVSGGSTGSTTGAPQADCLAEGCVGQGVCAADWDPDAEVRGVFECRFACVPLLEDTAWCADDASCCDAAARCTERGYCVLEEDAEGSTSEGGSTSTGGGA